MILIKFDKNRFSLKQVFLLCVFLLLFVDGGICVSAQEQDLELEPARVQEVYGIGSVSKMFGAAAVMRLVEQDLVELDAPVTDYIPEFEMADERYQLITVRMLLNHSSGLMGTTSESAFVFGKSTQDYHQILLNALKSQHLKADPGEYGVYCNDGFTLAEIIVERVSGMSFGAFIEQEFSRPLGLHNTFMPTEITGDEPIAQVYFGKRRLPWQNVQCLASGGIYSTPEDLCRFSQIFMESGNKILSEESRQAMAAPEYKNNRIGRLDNESSYGYGLGWDSVDAYPYSAYGIKALTKGGDTMTYGASLTVLPEQNLSVSVTSSGGSGEQCQLMAQAIIMEVLQENGLIEPAAQEQAADSPSQSAAQPIPEALKKYEGYYASSEIWKVEMAENNRLILTCVENGSDMVQEYFYTKEGNFVSTDGKYIHFGELAQTSGGITGRTEFHFSEEANGKTYLLGTTYINYPGNTTWAVTVPFAEKITENTLPEHVRSAWEKRDKKRYYLVSECHNSLYNLTLPYLEIEQLSNFNGYTKAVENAKNCRILDENNAVCDLDLPVMIGRDLVDYRFWKESGTEYLQLGGFTFMEEEKMEDSEKLMNNISVGNYGKWYAVTEEDAGVQIQIQVPENGAYYIYDKDHNCTASSVFLEEMPFVLLPEGGKVLLSTDSSDDRQQSVFTVTR